MGFRFRKIFRPIPGLRLNLSKSGISASIGRPGATLNIGGRGSRFTAGLPGSGMSYSWFRGHRGNPREQLLDEGGDVSPGSNNNGWCGFLIIAALIVAVVAFCSKQKAAEPAALHPAAVLREARVMASKLNCRTKADQASDIIAQLPQGAGVKTVQVSDGWTLIRREQQNCWVATRYLAEPN